MLSSIIKEFEDTIDPNKVFNYFDFEIIKEELISTQNKIVFLLGEPGSGKSFLLNYLAKNFEDKYVLISEPFLSKEEFYKKCKDLGDKTILIDEAQLLSEEMIEFLRLLSDKGNRIVLAMHKKEGERIINLPQFKSRYSQKLYLTHLSYPEFERFITGKFIAHKKHHLLNKKSLKKIYKYTKGNFRLSKKFVFTALRLLNFSLKNQHRYKEIDNCIITMSAIELGLER
ncbi:MAG: ATP-binding protein [Epsilonproteobacteria bacterium]|nr:ATP-binding protein [Campylobacterota bacterium]